MLHRLREAADTGKSFLGESQRYANEFAFRLNEGDTRRYSLARIESLIRGGEGKRLTYESLTA